MSWRVGTIVALRDESSRARTLTLEVAGWPGHTAGQHVDIRLTAEDGYSARRSYSIASAPTGDDRLDVTVERIDDGEVSPYLTLGVSVGDQLEVRGPVGGWFVWRPTQTEPAQLVAGGSGLVPLMAMLRAHAASGQGSAMRLLYSVRDPASVLYAKELARRDGQVTIAYTREAPAGSSRRPARVDAALLAEVALQAEHMPTCYICGPTGFVETTSALLVEAGHDPSRVRTERFGPTGGRP
jgi:ferredoxin-NADP reductase